ncbi:hypothetical protein BGX29_002438 [Mortierella sp. GBA35]|nr:hypothetical protein BGX29_002438 [Mortierella sp. GBA35]
MRANLKELDLGATNLNMETLLFNKVPQLERLHVYHTRGLSILDQDFGGLRPLVLQDNIALDSLFKMLDHLPGLERLRIKGLRFLETSIASALVAARIERSACPLSVWALELDESRRNRDDLLALIVAQFPRLVQIRAPKIYQRTLQAWWNHCYDWTPTP